MEDPGGSSLDEEVTMTKRIAFVVVAVTGLLAALAPSFGSSGTPTTEYVIRVTSDTPGQEVKFDAAILIKNQQAPLTTMTRRTPFELRSSGYAASAMFRADGDASLQVEVVGNQGGEQKSRSRATGRAIVVGNNVAQDAGGFIASF
jgi:hypothetical protein